MATVNNILSSPSVPGNSRQWIEKLARWGFAAKGFVYVLIGILAVMAAIGQGSGNASKQGAAQMIFDQPFGKFLAVLVVIGILSFVVWRFVQAFNSKDTGTSKNKTMLKRARYGFSGLIYLTFAVTLIRMIMGSGGGGGNGRQQLVGKVLEMDFGPFLVGAAGIGVMIAGIYQWVRAYKEEYMKKLSFSGASSGMRENANKIGKVGYAARGIVWLLVGFFLLQAGIHSDAGKAQGQGAAFDSIEQWGGSWVLLIVALGVVAYGVFMFVKSKYYQVQSEF